MKTFITVAKMVNNHRLYTETEMSKSVKRAMVRYGIETKNALNKKQNSKMLTDDDMTLINRACFILAQPFGTQLSARVINSFYKVMYPYHMIYKKLVEKKVKEAMKEKSN